MLPLLRFSPILKRARWGGRNLATLLHKRVGTEPDYSESWEISDLDGNESVLSGGGLEGVTLRQLIRERGPELLGRNSRAYDRFPLLLKFLDASDQLSLQVHPNDEQARSSDRGENGKTEAWYILEAAPDAVVYAGLTPGTTLPEFAHSLKEGKCEDYLRKLPVKRNDCLLIPAGTVHAIGAGVVLLEVQQSSDMTYRLHDWGWVDSQGRGRDLHQEQGLRCINPANSPEIVAEASTLAEKTGYEEPLVDCEYFRISRIRVRGTATIEPGEMRILSAIRGHGEIESNETTEPLRAGDTILVPASTGLLRIQGEGLDFIETKLG